MVVGAIPIPYEDWRALSGENPADDDERNPKRPELSGNDRLFGAFVHGPVSYVELYYPENGTFGFKLVPDYRMEDPPGLATEQILVGSGGWYDRANETERDWPDAMTIHVDGATAIRENSRLVRALGNRILNLRPRRDDYAGATVHTPDSAQLREGTFGQYR